MTTTSGRTSRDRRVKRVPLAADALLALLRDLTGTHPVRCLNLPADARAVGVTHPWHLANTVFLFIESAEFPEVPEGAEPGELELVFERR